MFLLDWGVPGEEDGDIGLEYYVCDALPWAIRETLRESGEEELSLLGWCIGGTLCAMHAALEPDSPVRNLALLTTPIDTDGGALHELDPARLVRPRASWPTPIPSIPGPAIDFANKMMKPVTNYWTTYRQLWEGVLEGKDPRSSYQPMAKWVANNPPFPGRAFREWTTWMYKENRLVDGRLRLRGERVDLGEIEQNLLVVTAGADHIAPPPGTRPLLDLVSSEDVTHFDRPGGPHRPDGRLEGAGGDMARHRRSGLDSRSDR